MKKIPGVQEEEDILPAVRRLFRRWQWASGDLRTLREEERQGNSRREHTPRKGHERRERRGSRGAFLRDVAFAGHHAYVTLREGHVRAYNTIRGVIPPSPLPDTSSTSTSTSPSSPLPWTLFLVPRLSIGDPSIPRSSIHSFLKCIYYMEWEALQDLKNLENISFLSVALTHFFLL